MVMRVDIRYCFRRKVDWFYNRNQEREDIKYGGRIKDYSTRSPLKTQTNKNNKKNEWSSWDESHFGARKCT